MTSAATVAGAVRANFLMRCCPLPGRRRGSVGAGRALGAGIQPVRQVLVAEGCAVLLGSLRVVGVDRLDPRGLQRGDRLVDLRRARFRSGLPLLLERLDRPFGVLHGLAQIEELLVRGSTELARAHGVLALVRLTAERGVASPARPPPRGPARSPPPPPRTPPPRPPRTPPATPPRRRPTRPPPRHRAPPPCPPP